MKRRAAVGTVENDEKRKKLNNSKMVKTETQPQNCLSKQRPFPNLASLLIHRSFKGNVIFKSLSGSYCMLGEQKWLKAARQLRISMLRQLTMSPVQLSVETDAYERRVPGFVNCMKFDSLGALLAVGN